MLKRLVMLLSGVLKGLFFPRSTGAAEAPSPIAKPLRANSTRKPKDAQSPKRQPQSPARPRLSKETKAVTPTKVASKSTSKKPKPVQTDKPQSSRGNSTQTPVSKIRQPAKLLQTAELKPVVQTKAVKKLTKGSTSAQTRTARQSKGNGS